MLQKIKNSYFFSNRFFSLCLVFFISFSIFSFSFGVKKDVKADTFSAHYVKDHALEIIIATLGSLGVTVSVPFANEFYDDLKESSSNSDLPTWNNHGLMDYLPQGVQYVKEKAHEGYVASNDFVNKLVEAWNVYIDNVREKPSTIHGAIQVLSTSGTVSVPPGDYTVVLYHRYTNGNVGPTDQSTHVTVNKKGIISWELTSSALFHMDKCVMIDSGVGAFPTLEVPKDYCGVQIWEGDYDRTRYKPKYDVNTKPLDSKKDIYLPMPIVDSVSSSVNPQPVDSNVSAKDYTTTFPVGNVQTGNLTTTPVTGFPKDVAIVGSPVDVGGVPWADYPSKPVEGVDGKPVDKPIDKPIDKPVDKPIDKPLDKPVGGIGENIWDKILEFLKKILIPNDNFFIDEFKSLESELNGKFDGNGLNYISDFKNNSKSVDPKFVYTFVIMGTTVTLDFSFVTRIVPLCHIVFGGLTLLFLAWYHYKNVLLLIRGISPVEGGNFTGNSNTGIDFKAMGDSAPSSPVSTSKGNGNYSTTNKYSGGAK